MNSLNDSLVATSIMAVWEVQGLLAVPDLAYL